ncbi:MAG: SMP-30/gluconolactonase/LRE family protein [Bacteroidota bacterium]
MAIDTEGRLVMAQQEYRRMSRMETDGSVTPIATHFEGLRLNIPNDVAIKSDSEDKEVYAWDVEDTVITNKRLFTTIGGNGYIDGMTTDDQGRVYVASPLGIQVFEEDGARADTIRIGKQCSNCSWGEEVGKDLFVTCGTELYRVNRQGPGVGFREVESGTTSKTELFAPIPNPFHEGTLLSFQISSPSRLRLNIYNISGSFIGTLLDQATPHGTFHIEWHTGNLDPGVYFIQLETETGIQSFQCVKY